MEWSGVKCSLPAVMSGADLFLAAPLLAPQLVLSDAVSVCSSQPRLQPKRISCSLALFVMVLFIIYETIVNISLLHNIPGSLPLCLAEVNECREECRELCNACCLQWKGVSFIIYIKRVSGSLRVVEMSFSVDETCFTIALHKNHIIFGILTA